ncbi:MAG: hypothetical protein IJY39_09810 [Clostridia bacterium]|nr:hypothetical protein [Clostridia bacterium]
MKSPCPRCPWCGHKLPAGDTFSKKLKCGLSPVHQCQKCKNPLTSFVSTLIYTPILFIFICIYINSNSFLVTLLLCAAALILLSCLIPICLGRVKYKKMGLDGKALAEDMVKHTGFVAHSDSLPKLRRGQILITDPSFDSAKPFSASSPIKVLRYSKEKQRLSFAFLYVNDKTELLLSEKSFRGYAVDENGSLTCQYSVSLNRSDSL